MNEYADNGPSSVSVKNFLRQLFGFSKKTASKQVVVRPPVSVDNSPATQRMETAPVWQAQVDVDGLFFDWLFHTSEQTRTRANRLDESMERAIIGALEKLNQSELAGSNLLPRVPSVLPQLLKSLREEHVSGAELARHIGKDMVLVAELIQEVNSAYYHPVDKIINLDNAIRMLGQNGLRMLVARVSFRPIIHIGSGHLTKLVTPRIWEHADKCALACRLLAQQRGQDPFGAFLAGLMQNVGLVVACRIIDHVCEPGNIPNSAKFNSALIVAARALSCNIARHWDFPESVIQAIHDSTQPGLSGLQLCLQQADTLSKIYLLVQDAQLKPDDPALQLDQDECIRACYSALNSAQ